MGRAHEATDRIAQVQGGEFGEDTDQEPLNIEEASWGCGVRTRQRAVSLKQERGFTRVHCSWDLVTKNTRRQNGAIGALTVCLVSTRSGKGGSPSKDRLHGWTRGQRQRSG